MRHAILGVGGVGGFIGAVLADAGQSVTAVVRPGSTVEHPRRLIVESPLGSAAGAIDCATKITASFDVLWIAVKAPALEAALDALESPEMVAAIVPLLNGVDHVALLRRRYGVARVIPATLLGECERLAPGRIAHRSPFLEVRVLESGRARLAEPIEALQRFGVNCRFVANEATLLWSKLVVLAPLALTTSAAAAPFGEVLGSPTWRPLLESAHLEACKVAAASGASIDVAATRRSLLGLPASLRSSMQKDVEMGRPPELDAIGGPIVRGAVEHHLDAPATTALVDHVRARCVRDT